MVLNLIVKIKDKKSLISGLQKMITTACNGVTFYEEFPDNYRVGMNISTQVSGLFSETQLASLDAIKQQMAAYCKWQNSDTIIGFIFEERKITGFASMFSSSNTVWYAEGYVGISTLLRR